MTYRDLDQLRARIRPGIPVVGENGDQVGTVKAALADGLCVDRRLKFDLLIPYENVDSVKQTGVMLNVLTSDADVMVELSLR